MVDICRPSFRVKTQKRRAEEPAPTTLPKQKAINLLDAYTDTGKKKKR
jgi:hypothetical protein